MAPSGVARGTVKVAAIYGSLRKGSYNRRLIQSVIELSKGAVEGVEIEEVDIASLPMLNTDLEKQGTFPAEVEAFCRKILEAGSILFASPEYNFFVTAPLEIAMDWGSRPPNVWGGKAAGIVTVKTHCGFELTVVQSSSNTLAEGEIEKRESERTSGVDELEMKREAYRYSILPYGA